LKAVTPIDIAFSITSKKALISKGFFRKPSAFVLLAMTLTSGFAEKRYDWDIIGFAVFFYKSGGLLSAYRWYPQFQ